MRPKLTMLKRQVQTVDTSRGGSVAVERIRGHELVKIRERIALRDRYTCQRCGRVTTKGQVDHKVPLHLGGRESDENRQWLCVPCHDEKSAAEEEGRDG